jgi:hypothetical protein
VIKQIAEVAYLLDLSLESRIHPIFYVSCLKQKLGQRMIPLHTLPLLDAHGEIKPEPEQILQHRVLKLHNQVISEVSVH